MLKRKQKIKVTTSKITTEIENSRKRIEYETQKINDEQRKKNKEAGRYMNILLYP